VKTLSSLSDFELVQKYVQEEDRTSIEVLINRHRKKIFTYIVLIVKDQHLAEDVFQETFIKVFKSLKGGPIP